MAARTGEQYLQGLRDARSVWLNGEKVSDVTTHPALAGAANSMAALYDLQHRHAGTCLMPDPDSGEPVNVTHVIPRGPADLQARHAAIEQIARHTLGVMGRSPDYLNVTLAGFAGRCDQWAEAGNEAGAERLVAFQRQCRREDWAMTHALIHPTVDKSLGDATGINGEVAVQKVGETANGIIVRGARALATLAPFSDEMFVYPGRPLPKEASPAHALAFSVPLATPGMKILCRDSYSLPGPTADHPFSTRFDEQDAIVIFDDVEVPHERVFLDGLPEVYNKVMTSGWTANIMQQTSIRAWVKLEFAYQLATRMVEVVNGAGLATSELLGELWSYAELTRSAVAAAEAGAHEWGNGVWFCDERPFRALRPTLPRWFPRVHEILKLLGSHNLLATPTAAEMADPELRPLIDRYYPGARGVSAEERIRIFRTAWDFAGSALGGRNELYERFYLASSSRTYQIAHVMTQHERKGESPLLDEMLRDTSP